MTNRISAAATGLPATTTRRRALASLAGLGAAVSLPGLAKASSALDAPDAVLIAHAAMVEEMAGRYHTALTRWVKLDVKANAARPSRPDRKEVEVPSKSRVEYGPDGSIVSIFLTPVDPAVALAEKQDKAAYEAWEQACDDLAETMGVDAAGGLVDDLQAALADVVDDLTSMAATTPAGLAAKARAAIALDPHHDLSMDEREQALFVSLAHDVVSIGGAA